MYGIREERLAKSQIIEIGREAMKKKILELKDKGLSNTEIAEKLGISESSVRMRLKK